jgi:MHS family metabolite:H+ symporter-like MFS transporter
MLRNFENIRSTMNNNAVKTKELVKVVSSGWFGTAMEFMDFQLYSLAAAIVFNRIFFPDFDPSMGIVLAMGTYGAGYVARLVGAWVFGRIGDRIGRKTVLFMTIMLMGIASTLIGFLPTYDEVGIIAPIGLVALRIAQGLGAGAEISGAGVMVVEFASTKRRGIIGSLVCLGTSTGTLLANLIWGVIIANCTDQELLSWGWRIPFYASFVVMIFAVVIRLFIKESPVIEERKRLLEQKRESATGLSETVMSETKTASAIKVPVTGVKSFLVALGLRFGQAGNSGLMQTYLAAFIVTVLAMEKTVATNANIISSCVAFITIPIVGLLGDKIGRRKMYIILSLLMTIYAIPMMVLLQSANAVLVTIAMVIGLNLGVQALFSLENVTLAELFGSRNRMTLMALAKEVAGLVATGFGPVIAAALVGAFFNSWIPIAVMMVIFSASSLVAAFVSKDPSGRDLNELENAM